MWEFPLTTGGLGGIAANQNFVVFGSRDIEDQLDVFYCLDANLGLLTWTIEYPATGDLDYGNSPRSTPMIVGEHAYLFGAFGDIVCVDLALGDIVWQKNIRDEFAAMAELPWGYWCITPDRGQ